MIRGIGVDLVEISRIRAAIMGFGNRFKQRVCTARELELSANFDISSKKFFSFFAKRFAAKEAFTKALGYGIGKKISFQDVEILNDFKGKPYVNEELLKSSVDLFSGSGDLKGIRIHISISDTDKYATAYVVIEQH